MKSAFILIFAFLAAAFFSAPLRAEYTREQDMRFGVYSRGLKVGLGLARAESSAGNGGGSGLAFSTGLFTSFGWRGRIQIQPEINFLARESELRDEVLLGGSPSGLYRDTSYELSEGQAGALLKLSSPRWADPKKSKGRLDPHQSRQRRWSPYLAGGAMAARVIESKRVIRLDSPSALPKSDSWADDSRVSLEWVAAAGFEYMRSAGGGVGLEARWQLRDRPLATGLGDSLKISTWTLNFLLLF
jgi:hypothetical protein